MTQAWGKEEAWGKEQTWGKKCYKPMCFQDHGEVDIGHGTLSRHVEKVGPRLTEKAARSIQLEKATDAAEVQAAKKIDPKKAREIVMLRTKLGLTQLEVVQQLACIGPGVLSKMENGSYNGPIKTTVLVLDKLRKLKPKVTP